jgi:hypothetical protein
MCTLKFVNLIKAKLFEEIVFFVIDILHELAEGNPEHSEEITDVKDNKEELQGLHDIVGHHKKMNIVVIGQGVFADLWMGLDHVFNSFFHDVLDATHQLGDIEDLDASKNTDDLQREQKVNLFEFNEDPDQRYKRNELDPEAVSVEMHKNLVKVSDRLSITIRRELSEEVNGKAD